jgi:hypothetical protein
MRASLLSPILRLCAGAVMKMVEQEGLEPSVRFWLLGPCAANLPAP